jgi:hypothetical protein
MKRTKVMGVAVRPVKPEPAQELKHQPQPQTHPDQQRQEQQEQQQQAHA